MRLAKVGTEVTKNKAKVRAAIATIKALPSGLEDPHDSKEAGRILQTMDQPNWSHPEAAEPCQGSRFQEQVKSLEADLLQTLLWTARLMKNVCNKKQKRMLLDLKGEGIGQCRRSKYKFSMVLDARHVFA